MKSLINILLFFPMLVFSEPKEILFWHSMSGALQDNIKVMMKNFNDSQKDYKVTEVYKGTYNESLQASIAAYRAKKQPHIVQVFEVGTQTMMLSGAIYPLHELLKDTGTNIDFSTYIQPVLSYYMTSDQKLMSMPFNSSTPIMYFNKAMLSKAGIQTPPSTWEELEEVTGKLVKSGAKCGFTSTWPSWILAENFSAIHDVPFANPNNGYDGLNLKLNFNSPLVQKNMERLLSMTKDSRFSYEGRASDPGRNAFVSGKCAILLESSAGFGSIKKIVKFPWDVAPQPILKGSKVQNSIIGGATLWTFNGHPKEDYKGVAKFLEFVGSAKNQKWFHKETGYLPISKIAYDELKKEGYYKTEPGQEVAIKQLTRTQPNANSRGLRIGNFLQIRDILEEELERVWSGKKSVKEALDSAVSRGNVQLETFAKTYKGKTI